MQTKHNRREQRQKDKLLQKNRLVKMKAVEGRIGRCRIVRAETVDNNIKGKLNNPNVVAMSNILPLLVFYKIKGESLDWPHASVLLHSEYCLIKFLRSTFRGRHLSKYSCYKLL